MSSSEEIPTGGHDTEVQNNNMSAATSNPHQASSSLPIDPWNTPTLNQQQEEEELPKPAVTTTKNEEEETREALEKLKVSSQKLTSTIQHISSNIDERIGLSKGVDTIGHSVRHVNDTHQVSTKVSQTLEGATSKIGTWWNGIDQRLSLSSKTKAVTSSINESVVQPISTTTKEKLGQSSRAIKQFDQAHGITKTTAATLATGAEFLADSAIAITGGDNVAGADHEIDQDNSNELLMDDETQEIDNDGLPSSFQRDTTTTPDIADV